MKKENKLALSISLGFVIGAFAGVILGLLSTDPALWLSVGVGIGLVFGSLAGLYIMRKRRDE